MRGSTVSAERVRGVGEMVRGVGERVRGVGERERGKGWGRGWGMGERVRGVGERERKEQLNRERKGREFELVVRSLYMSSPPLLQARFHPKGEYNPALKKKVKKKKKKGKGGQEK